jgi:MFS family permease
MLTKGTFAPTAWERDRTPVGLTIAGGVTMLVGAALVTSLTPSHDSVLRVGLVAVALAAFAASTGEPLAMAALVPIAWLVVNGFLVDRYGELAWHGWADVYRALVLAAASVAGLALSTRLRKEPRHG